MRPRPPNMGQEQKRTGRVDTRRVYLPAEIPAAFQTASQRFEATRPSTSETQRLQQIGNRYVAETTSYLPKIRESVIARDRREKQTTTAKQSRQVWSRPSRTPGTLPRSKQVPPEAAAKPLSRLDQDGMAMMRLAFEKHGRLCEKDFIAEMIFALKSQHEPWDQQVDLTRELSTLYQQADIHAVGYLSWEDFSSYFFKTSDVCSVEEDIPFEKLDCSTKPLHMTTELHGMYYFKEVDQIFLHDASKGFRMLHASTNTIAGEVNSLSRGGGIMDAVYAPIGRYVITASTSPVIALYDVDKLRLRQQIPTETAQTALQLPSDPAISRLYSCSTDGQVHIWNLGTLSCLMSFFPQGHEAMTEIAAIDNTNFLAASCLDGKIYVIDMHAEHIAKTLNGHKQGVTTIKYCADKGYLVSGGVEHCLHLWNPLVEQHIGTLQGHKHQLIGVEVIPDTTQVISADESGEIMIWDLRKFSPIRTIKRGVYVKDRTQPRILTRPMTSMCYMPRRKRIAIAHSSIFFFDQLDDLQDDTNAVGGKLPRNMPVSDMDENGCDLEERLKPLAVVLNRPSQSIVVITPRELQSWATSTGILIQRDKLRLGADVICVSVVDDHNSCVVGTENGTVARLMLPRGSVIVSKRLHSAEVSAVCWVNSSRQVISGSFDGTILISMSTTLEILHTINHWDGIQSLQERNHPIAGGNVKRVGTTSSELPPSTHDDIERFKRLFGAADYSQTGKITAFKADELLDNAFHKLPSEVVQEVHNNVGATKRLFTGREVVTLTMFLKKATAKLKDLRQAARQRKEHRRHNAAPAIAVHGKLQQLVTASPLDGRFCVWNLKGGTAAGRGIIDPQCGDGNTNGYEKQERTKLQQPLVSRVVYLDPFPYFVLVEEGNGAQLSIWSSLAIPPVFLHAYQCILRFQYDVSPQQQQQSLADSVPNPSELSCKVKREVAIVCATAWSPGGRNGESIFCVGDDRGHVVVYDFSELLKCIDEMCKSPNSASTRWGFCTANVTPGDVLLPPSLLSIRCRWVVHNGDPIRTLSMINVIDDAQEICMVVAAAVDSGSTFFFSMDGKCLGNLGNRHFTNWQFNASANKSIAVEHSTADQVLQEMKAHRRKSSMYRRRSSKAEQDMIRDAVLTEDKCERDKTEKYSKDRPTLSRFLALTKPM